MESTQLKTAADVSVSGFDNKPLFVALTVALLALALTLGFALAHAIETRWVFVN